MDKEEYFINPRDLSVVLLKDFMLDGSHNLPNGLLPVRFEKATGDFIIRRARLKSLRGTPKFVGGLFDCSDNLLKSLEFGPEIVIEGYNCSRNEITNLKFLPKSVKKLSIYHNTNLESLVGTSSVEELHMSNCNVKSLKGIKKCSLLYITDCKLNSLDYLPSVMSEIYIGANSITKSTISRSDGVKTLVTKDGSLEVEDASNFKDVFAENSKLSFFTDLLKTASLELFSFNCTVAIKRYGSSSNDQENIEQFFKILKKTKSANGSIFDFQSELIDANLDDFATFAD